MPGSVRDQNTGVLRIGTEVTVEGGYAQDSWNEPDPARNTTTVDGMDGAGVVATGGANATLRYLTVTNSYYGVVVDAGADVKIEHCTIENNNGAAINGFGTGVTNGGTLSITGSLIRNNSSAYGGGGVRSTGSLLMRNNTVANNTVTTGYGGGVME